MACRGVLFCYGCGLTTIRIGRIRGRIADLGVPNDAEFPPVQVKAFLSLTGISVDNNVLTVAVPIAPPKPDPVPPSIPALPTLLFPFVTNQGGFDTGIAISNTSKDHLGTIEQSGSCSLHFHSTTATGETVSFDRYAPFIPAGKVVAFTLSAGNPQFGIGGPAGFQGYLFAICSFPFVHGVAFIVDGFGGTPGLKQGYLALVVPRDPEMGRLPGGTNSGENLSH